jgi:hypothetical protein
MKNVMKFGLAVAVFLTAFGMRANDTDFSVSVRSGLGKLVNFSINNSKAHVAIYATDGEIIFEENLKAKDGKISRTYDLAALPEGSYYLEAETGAKLTRYEIKIAEKLATVSEKAVVELFKPVFTNKDGRVTININGTASPVEIKLYDENNVELYNETLATVDNKLAKTFDMTNAKASKYTFVMKYNNKMFVETIAAR